MNSYHQIQEKEEKTKRKRNMKGEKNMIILEKLEIFNIES